MDFDYPDDYFQDLPTAGFDPHWTVADNRGAGNFLKVLLDEIKPSIDREFPTDPNDTGIGGHSLGGFFALYALFNAPNIFGHVYASSPSFEWQDFVLLREEAKAARRMTDLKARVYVDQGALEGDDGRIETLGRSILGRSYPSIRWEWYRKAGQTHQTIGFADGVDALYAIYGPVLRRASPSELSELAGEYLVTDGTRFRLEQADNRLFIVGLRGNEDRTELLSDERGSWLIRYLLTHLTITDSKDRDLTLKLTFKATPGPNGAPATSVVTAKRIGS